MGAYNRQSQTPCIQKSNDENEACTTKVVRHTLNTSCQSKYEQKIVILSCYHISQRENVSILWLRKDGHDANPSGNSQEDSGLTSPDTAGSRPTRDRGYRTLFSFAHSEATQLSFWVKNVNSLKIMFWKHFKKLLAATNEIN